jgi:formyl-CoA transferase
MAGPFCGMLLADMGADVLKIENPQGGDFSRQSGPFIHGEGSGFVAVNRNKRSVALNLKAGQGRELFLRLVQSADVLVENYRPGTMADLGLAYETLSALNPRLIYSAATGYGQTGPYAHRAALDLILQGMSGIMSITGEGGRPPVKVGVPIADLSAALFGAYAILGALFAREKTGLGQQIDVSLMESAMALEVWETSGYFASGKVPEPLGSAHRVSAPYQAFRTADGYITIGATSPLNWHACCEVLGLQALEHDERFAVVSARRSHYRELAELIESVTLSRPGKHWYRAMEAAGVPCGVLNTIDQAVDDEHIRARGFIVDLPHTSAGTVRATGSPVRLSGTPIRLDHAGPLLGEHTAAILSELGVDGKQLTALAKAGVVGLP